MASIQELEQELILQPDVVTAFIAGIVLANLNKNLLLRYTTDLPIYLTLHPLPFRDHFSTTLF